MNLLSGSSKSRAEVRAAVYCFMPAAHPAQAMFWNILRHILILRCFFQTRISRARRSIKSALTSFAVLGGRHRSAPVLRWWGTIPPPRNSSASRAVWRVRPRAENAAGRASGCALKKARATRRKTALIATTLTVSPHKNAAVINEIGLSAAQQAGTCYMPSDFKKRGGYQRSIELSRQYGLYRQNYCGCVFSRSAEEKTHPLNGSKDN